MINLEGVTKRYNKQSTALEDIHLNVEPGEFVSIVGQSGSGKTTLVKLIIAEERATSGKVSIGDWDITRIPYRHVPLLRRQIGVIFQDFKLLDKKTIYMVISRPISRSEYLVGKFLGIVILAMAVVVFLGLLSIVPVIMSKRFYYYPEARFDWWIYFIAVVYIFIKLAIVSSIITLFASFTSNSFIALILSLVAYIIGQSTEGVRLLLSSKVEKIDVSPVLSYMAGIAYYIFPNISAFDLKTQAAHGLSISPSYIIWTTLYAVFYIVIALSIGALAFRRREFP